MTKYLVSFLLLSCLQVSAQDGAVPPGRWVKGMRGSVNGISSEELKQERLITERIHQSISAAYKPSGIDATYAESHGYQSAEQGKEYFANPYAYSLYIVKPGEGESRTNFFAYANSMEWVNYLRCTKREYQPPFILMRAIPEERNGYVFFNLNPDLDPKDTSYTAYLITYPGKMPFAPVSRKEYLEYRRTQLLAEQKKKTDAAVKSMQPVRSQAEQEDAKQKTMDDIRAGKWGSNPEARLQRFLAEYKTDEQLRDEALSKVGSFFQASIDRIDALLTNSSAEDLMQPAIVNEGPYDQDFSGFKEEREGYRVIRIDPTYFKPGLPRSVPQFFTLFFKTNRNNPVYEENMRAVKSAVNIEFFRDLLGKVPGALAVAVANPPAGKPVAAVKATEPGNKAVDVLENKPSPGFVQTPLAQVKQVVQVPAANPARTRAAMGIRLSASTLQPFMRTLLTDIEKNLAEQARANTVILSSTISDPQDLADVGVLLYYKGAVEESLWCLAKAAATDSRNDAVLSNLSAILNLSGAEIRALPILNYLRGKYPQSSTVLNNLGQALYGLGEWQQSKPVLDSCLRIFRSHPQANFTRSLIADKEGKQAESISFLERSMQGAFFESQEELARRKNIKLDYARLLNRRHPTQPDYFNPMKYLPPAQCTNVDSAAGSEAEWKAWDRAMKGVQARIEANLKAAEANLARDQQANKQGRPMLSPMIRKAQIMYYQVYGPAAADVTRDATAYYSGQYTRAKNEITRKRNERFAAVEKKYAGAFGEGKDNPFGARCQEVNALNNDYLQEMANLNDAFNLRFAQSTRLLNAELMYWSLMLGGSKSMREVNYYKHAMIACAPLQVTTAYAMPCGVVPEPREVKKELEAPEAFCPISFRFKVAVAKLTGDCSKFDLELELDGFVFNFERNFKKKTSTVAFGMGASWEFESLEGKWVTAAETIASAGGGLGMKSQVFVTYGKDGEISDFGVRAEAGFESGFTEKGDIKVTATISVESGVSLEPTETFTRIGEALSK